MFSSSARSVVVTMMFLVPSTAFAQVDLKPTPPPTITAENANWYQVKDPIVFAGNTYYPAGPQEFFNANEMVRSGYYRGVPIYTRTTEGPYGKVYVPLSGKLMQPYERRREGELAGTVGSSTPSFPVQRSIDPVPIATAGAAPEAPGPPTSVGSEPVPAAAAPAIARPATPKRGAGVVSVFIEYGGRKWYSSGGPVQNAASRFRVIGKYHDLPVYADRTDSGTIYIPVEKSENALLAPYSRHR